MTICHMGTNQRRLILTAFLALALFVPPAVFADNGLVADYTFSSRGGGETTLKDESGNGNHGTIHGAQWTRTKQGFCLNFDGQNDYVDCGAGPSLDLRKAATVEVWVKPETNPGVDAGIAGKHFSNYDLTLYKGRYWWYISSGGNNVKSAAKIRSWQHVVGTFDGRDMKLYVDGKFTASKVSKLPSIYKGSRMYIGCMVGDASAKDPAERRSGYFHGMIGRVRIYNKALSLEQVQEHYVAEAKQYIDALRLDKLHLAAYPYFDKKKIVVEIDYSSLLSVPRNAAIQLEIAGPAGGEPLMKRKASVSARDVGVEVKWTVAALKPGSYVVRASLGENHAERAFKYADSPPARAPAPEKRVAKPLPAPARPVAYNF